MASNELFSISKRTNEMFDGLLKEGTSHIQSPFLFLLSANPHFLSFPHQNCLFSQTKQKLIHAFF